MSIILMMKGTILIMTQVLNIMMIIHIPEESIDLEEIVVRLIFTHQISIIAMISGMIHFITHTLEIIRL